MVTPMVSFGGEMASGFKVDGVSCFVFLNLQGFLCICPSIQDTYNGALLFSLWNFLGTNTALTRLNKTEKDKFHNLSCRARNSSWRGLTLTGFAMLLIASSGKSATEFLISGIVVGSFTI